MTKYSNIERVVVHVGFGGVDKASYPLLILEVRGSNPAFESRSELLYPEALEAPRGAGHINGSLD